MNSLSLSLIQSYHLTHLQYGWISTLDAWTNMLFILFAGALLDYFNPKRVMLYALILLLLSCTCYAFQQNMLTLIVWRLTAGVTACFYVIGILKIISEKTAQHHMAVTVGLIGIVIMSSGMLAQKSLLITFNLYGIRAVLLNLNVVGLLAGIILTKTTATTSSQYSNFSDYKIIFKIMANWKLSIVASIINFPVTLLGATFSNLWLIHHFHLNINTTATLACFLFLGHVIGAPCIGHYSDRLQERTKVIGVSSLMQGSLYILLLIAPDNIILLASVFFGLGFFSGAHTVVYAALTKANEREHRGKVLAMVAFLSALITIISQPFFAYLLTKDLEVRMLISAALVNVLLCFLCSLD